MMTVCRKVGKMINIDPDMRTREASIPQIGSHVWNPAFSEQKTQMGNLEILRIRARQFGDRIFCLVLFGTIDKIFFSFLSNKLVFGMRIGIPDKD